MWTENLCKDVPELYRECSRVWGGGGLLLYTFWFSLKSMLNRKGCVTLVLVAEVPPWGSCPSPFLVRAPLVPSCVWRELGVAGLTLTLLTVVAPLLNGNWFWSVWQLLWGPSCNACPLPQGRTQGRGSRWRAEPSLRSLGPRRHAWPMPPRFRLREQGCKRGVACGRLAGEPGLMKISTFFSEPLTVCYQHGLPPSNRLLLLSH